MFGEITGGYIAHSIAIMTDAAHMFSDVAGFMISYFAIYLGGKPSNNSLSFGYARAEILGALASILLIWGLCIWLFIEAINRVVEPEDVNGEVMLITAAVGLACNFVNIFTLHSCGGSHHGHSHGEEHIHENEGEQAAERKLSHCHQPLFEQLSRAASLRHSRTASLK
jgi:zinc transporter 2